jgi:hypothetical protein
MVRSAHEKSRTRAADRSPSTNKAAIATTKAAITSQAARSIGCHWGLPLGVFCHRCCTDRHIPNQKFLS